MSSSLNLFQTEWFAQQKELSTEFESMAVEEMNNFLSNFYLSARKKRRQLLQESKFMVNQSRLRSPFAFTSVQQESLIYLRHCSV